jgi:hypothetical protein
MWYKIVRSESRRREGPGLPPGETAILAGKQSRGKKNVGRVFVIVMMKTSFCVMYDASIIIIFYGRKFKPLTLTYQMT